MARKVYSYQKSNLFTKDLIGKVSKMKFMSDKSQSVVKLVTFMK